MNIPMPSANTATALQPQDCDEGNEGNDDDTKTSRRRRDDLSEGDDKDHNDEGNGEDFPTHFGI